MSNPFVIDIVARQLLANTIDNMEWEDMPDIGENDWLRIIERCKELAPEPDGFDAAITTLVDRAQQWREDNDDV